MAERRMQEQGAVPQNVRVRAGTEAGTQQQELATRESSFVPPGRAYHHHHRGRSTGAAAHGTVGGGADDDSGPLKVRRNVWSISRKPSTRG